MSMSILCQCMLYYLSVDWSVEDDRYLCGTSNVEGQCLYREVPRNQSIADILGHRCTTIAGRTVIISSRTEAEVVELFYFECGIAGEEGHPPF